MQNMEDPDARPKGVFTRFVLPGFAFVLLAGCVAGVAWEFSQDMEKRSEIAGYQLETNTISIDAPATPRQETVAMAPVPEPFVEPAVVQVAAAPRQAKAVESGAAALAAIRSVAPTSIAPASAPIAQPTEQLAYGAAPDVGTSEFLVVAGDGRLNVRSGPSKDDDKLFALRVGSKIEVLGRNAEWTRIRDDEKRIGWASSEFLMDPVEAEKVAAAAEAERAAAETMEVKSGVNVRSGPGRTYGKVFGLASGDDVEVLDRSKGWIKVETEAGKTGWVYQSFLR